MDWVSFFLGLAGGVGALIAGGAVKRRFEAARAPGSAEDWKNVERATEKKRKEMRDREDAKK